ncbi:group II intron reverse transcriptase/maturase [Streptomyces pseudovenezuelae]|uniref:Group II intron reverse transcriptase/maturase n=1 Tax=Streptomyces pseudovenezuelae TaxID=67350 RepID=A0ABT6M338_9ACTN|nr:reverse transcriptase/maturase family protein [Streptomyces pseudovenezuelae]MDH6222967.1 group II intron reverse transcriptase/maturase [Streptomyces pseudovenezuelae]
MQSAEVVLDVLRERGRRGLSLERLYRQLFNRELYLVAYRKLYSNAGAMTPGVTGETVDGMSLEKIDLIIDMVRHERWRWSPVKRVRIPKKNGTRPLGLPGWSDKLLAEVVRMLLNAYYDVQFSDHSHGFRAGRGCHTALQEIVDVWNGTNWFIEGDISKCFESLDHEVLMKTLGEKVHDYRFLRLVSRILKVGYVEDWRWGATLSGAPQGGIASPVLSNIYLDRLDKYVEQQLLPLFNRGKRRAPNPAYEKISSEIRSARRRGDRAGVRALCLQRRTLPSKDLNDPGYRRLRYVRYCDDILLGFSGPKAEAREIKRMLGQFLQEELKLELSQEKTLITHARTGKARFLGYDIVTQHANDKLTNGKRSINGEIGLRVPDEAITRRCAPYMRHGKPWLRPQMLSDQDYSIISQYQAEYRGVVQYYIRATNVCHLNRLHWVMESSMLKTLAGKHRSSVVKMARKYKTTIDTPVGPRVCFQAVVNRGEGKKPLVARSGRTPTADGPLRPALQRHATAPPPRPGLHEPALHAAPSLRSPTAPTTSTTRDPDVTVLPGLTDENTSIMKEPQLFELRFGWPQRSQIPVSRCPRSRGRFNLTTHHHPDAAGRRHPQHTGPWKPAPPARQPTRTPTRRSLTGRTEATSRAQDQPATVVNDRGRGLHESNIYLNLT